MHQWCKLDKLLHRFSGTALYTMHHKFLVSGAYCMAAQKPWQVDLLTPTVVPKYGLLYPRCKRTTCIYLIQTHLTAINRRCSCKDGLTRLPDLCCSKNAPRTHSSDDTVKVVVRLCTLGSIICRLPIIVPTIIPELNASKHEIGSPAEIAKMPVGLTSLESEMLASDSDLFSITLTVHLIILDNPCSTASIALGFTQFVRRSRLEFEGASSFACGVRVRRIIGVTVQPAANQSE